MARVYLSPPHMEGDERQLLLEAFDANWIAPAGPDLERFEREICDLVGVPAAVALSSGTAALHLALLGLGAGPGDDVLVADLTFVASANAVSYTGARPVFLDADAATWTLDPDLLADELAERSRRGRLPRAVVAVDLYGQCADYSRLVELCATFGVPLVEDAAESLGSTHEGSAAGSFGQVGVFSFNGNKIITTSGGGMLVSHDTALVERARHLATQAREPALHYEHEVIGYNYRLSNVLAALGRGQLRTLAGKVQRRRAIFEHYHRLLSSLPGLTFMPESPKGTSNRWLTCLLVGDEFGATRDDLIAALEDADVESRPTWKPMHLQPAYRDAPCRGGAVGERIFERGLCLPSGSALSDADVERVAGIVAELAGTGASARASRSAARGAS
jgi:dTDP-4-amino-4,6-dideoxygalactose transaminase